MSDTAEYITLLVISIVVTVAVGRLLVQSGQPFLQEVFQNEKVTTSVNRLLSVLFHLITIGVLTIISAWSIDVGTQLQNMIVKFGIVLIVLGIAYGISMLVLIRRRGGGGAPRFPGGGKKNPRAPGKNPPPPPRPPPAPPHADAAGGPA